MTDDDDDDFEVTMVRPPNRIKDKVTLGGKITGDGFDEELLKEAEAKAAGLHDEFLEAVLGVGTGPEPPAFAVRR